MPHTLCGLLVNMMEGPADEADAGGNATSSPTARNNRQARMTTTTTTTDEQDDPAVSSFCRAPRNSIDATRPSRGTEWCQEQAVQRDDWVSEELGLLAVVSADNALLALPFSHYYRHQSPHNVLRVSRVVKKRFQTLKCQLQPQPVTSIESTM